MTLDTFIKKICFRIYLSSCWSDIKIIRLFRKLLLSIIWKSSPDGMIIDRSVRLSGVENISLGKNVSINWDSYISAEGGLTIGDNVSIGHRCSILTTEHTFTDPNIPIKFQPVTYASVKIGNNVWLGANVTILAGVELQDGTIVAAGAVVKKSYSEKNLILAGVPAKPIRQYA